MFSKILACTGSRFDRLVVALSLDAPAAGRFSGLQTEAQFMSNLVLNVDGSIGKPSHAGTKFELETRIMKPCWTIRHPWERKSKLLLSCSQ